MHAKLEANRPYANKIVKKRSATVELVLGTLINFLNMKKINSRGMDQANKHVLMAALTYNLKKLMKFERKQSVAHSPTNDQNRGRTTKFSDHLPKTIKRPSLGRS